MSGEPRSSDVSPAVVDSFPMSDPADLTEVVRYYSIGLDRDLLLLMFCSTCGF